MSEKLPSQVLGLRPDAEKRINQKEAGEIVVAPVLAKADSIGPGLIFLVRSHAEFEMATEARLPAVKVAEFGTDDRSKKVLLDLCRKCPGKLVFVFLEKGRDFLKWSFHSGITAMLSAIRKEFPKAEGRVGRLSRRNSEPLQDAVLRMLEKLEPVTTTGDLVLALLKRHEPTVQKIVEKDRPAAQRAFAELLAGLHDEPLVRSELCGFAEGLGFQRRPLQQEAKKLRNEALQAMLTRENGECALAIDLSQQPGIWVRVVLEAIKDETYVFAGKLVKLEAGKLSPFGWADFIGFVDSPERCQFVNRNTKGELKTVQLGRTTAEVILAGASTHADNLRTVEVVSKAPVLVESPSSPRGVEVITGYSQEHRILVQGGKLELSNDGHDAASDLMDLLRDFQFPDQHYAARALAMLITPALVRGGFIQDRAPFFPIFKHEKNTGSGWLFKLMCRIYGESPRTSCPDNAKEAKEDLSLALWDGTTIFCFDNIRGSVMRHLKFFESFLTEEWFIGRALWRHGSIDPRAVTVALTSNGCVLSEDLASRSVAITLRKQPLGYKFYSKWDGGSLLKHVELNQTHYLGAVYELITRWIEAGKPSGHTVGFRFPKWEAAVSWILENCFEPELTMFPFGIEGLEMEHRRLADPNFEFARRLAFSVVRRGKSRRFSAADLGAIAQEEGLLTGGHSLDAAREIGKKFRDLFKDGNQLRLEPGLEIRRTEKPGNEDTDYKPKKVYEFISADSPDAVSCAPARHGVKSGTKA